MWRSRSLAVWLRFGVSLVVKHGENTQKKSWMWFLPSVFDTLWLGYNWESRWAEAACLQCGFVASQQFPGQYGNDWKGNSQAVVLGFINRQMWLMKAKSVLLPRQQKYMYCFFCFCLSVNQQDISTRPQLRVCLYLDTVLWAKCSHLHTYLLIGTKSKRHCGARGEKYECPRIMNVCSKFVANSGSRWGETTKDFDFMLVRDPLPRPNFMAINLKISLEEVSYWVNDLTNSLPDIAVLVLSLQHHKYCFSRSIKGVGFDRWIGQAEDFGSEKSTVTVSLWISQNHPPNKHLFVLKIQHWFQNLVAKFF